MASAFLLIAAATTMRTARDLNVPGRPDLPLYGMEDFRDVFYYPVVALLDGRNPYDVTQYLPNYPVARPLAPYAPTTLLLHLPYGLLPYQVAGWTHHALDVLLVVVLAYLTLRICGIATSAARILGLAALILLSRPAQMNLHIGQCALYLVIATYLALELAPRRSALAGIALAITCVKPTFGIPLGILLLVRGDLAACAWGGVVTSVLLTAIGGVLVHAAGGVQPLLVSFQDSYTRLMLDPSAHPSSSIIRIDAVVVLTRLAAGRLGSAFEGALSLGMIAIGAAAVWSVEHRPDDHRLLSFSLACVTILACMYHQAYDGLLLAVPIVALTTGRVTSTSAVERAALRVALLAMLVPTFNYFATDTLVGTFGISGAWHAVVTSANSASMLVAFVTLTSATFAGWLRADARGDA
jgi:hypothetical protein